MFKRISVSATCIAGILANTVAYATILDFPACSGANDCLIVNPTDPASPYFNDLNSDGKNEIKANPNNGLLITWDEQQNVKLAANLPVDRVADSTLPFIGGSPGNFFINSGTIVTSHYLQWDPGNRSSVGVQATIRLDSDIIAFITADQKLFNTDNLLGLPDLDYADFGLRGLESGDSTTFGTDLTRVSTNWRAGSPGDWTRLIAAFSPSAEDERQNTVPEPSVLILLGLGLAGIGYGKRRRKIAA